MNLAELRKRVAEVLGVSVSQNELAFEVFTECVSEILTEGITLKVPRVGFFQIKTTNPKTKQIQQIQFSSLPEDFTKEARTLYLTIDVYPRIKNQIDFDSQVFSISVGKPLLPLLDNDHDTETSFALLRKSIEERVRELISESDQIPNFNLWEESFPSEEDELDSAVNLQEHLKDLNNEPDSNDKIDTDSTEDFLKQLLAQNNFQITDDFSNEDEERLESSPEIQNNASPIFDDGLFNPSGEFKTQELSIDDLLNDTSAKDEYLEIETNSSLQSFNLEEKPESIENDLSEILPISDIENSGEETDIESAPDSEMANDNFHNELNVDIPSENTIQLYENIIDLTEKDEIQNFAQEIQAQADIEEIVDDGYKADLKNDEVTANTDDLIFGETFDEINDIEESELVKVSDLLNVDEQIQDREDEISIEPPSSAKYLLYDQFEEGNKSSHNINWIIEEEHLQEIVQEELSEFDSEKIAGENSRLLNQLLDEPVKKTVIEEQKQNKTEEIEKPVTFSRPAAEKPSEILTGDSFEDKDDYDDDVKSFTKVEWNWGDELKEEFGLGSEEIEELNSIVMDDFGAELIETNEKEIQKDERDEVSDIITEFADEYARDLVSNEQEKIDLKKTRIDLFTKLEKTLEKEITFLKEELEKTKPIEEPENIVYSKLVTEEKELPKVDFKDEKVFLDFKTPPPKYEFYEEKPEPILTKPKRITILISPEERAQEESHQFQEPAPALIQQEIKTEPAKKKSGKIFWVVFSNIIVASIVVAYFLLSGKSNLNQNSADHSTANQQKENQVKDLTVPAAKNTILETNNNAVSNLAVDEFSDFPRTATPPAPIKQGTDLSTLNINPANNSTVQNQQQAVKSNTPETKPEQKGTSRSDLYKNVQGDIKINEMIFSDGKTFNFQHSSWRRKDLAEKEVSRLRDQGYNAFLIEAFLPEKGGTWYRVRIGSFKTEQEAVSFKNKNKF